MIAIARVWAVTLALAAEAPPSPAPSPSFPPSPAAQVRALLRDDRWTEALAIAREAHAKAPDDLDVTAALGEALYRASEFEEASSLLAPLGANDAAPPRGRVALALLRIAEGNEHEGISILNKAYAAAPDDLEVLYRAANAAPSRAEALTRLRRYLEIGAKEDPDRLRGAKETIHVYESLGDRKVWIAETNPERFELPLYAIRSAAGTTDGYAIQATLGPDRKVWLLLDTGSPGLFLDAHALKKAKYEALTGETVYGAAGNERQSGERGLLGSIDIGPLRYRDALVSTSQKDLEPAGRYQGILGISVLDGYRITLDLGRMKLRVERTDAPAEGTPYWVVNGQILVRAGVTDAQPGMFLFDTGASRSVLGSRYLASVSGVEPGEPAGVHTYGGTVPGARRVRGVRLKFQDLLSGFKVVNAFDLDLRSKTGGVEVSGFLGLDFLDGRVVTLDTKSQRVKVEGGGR